jgi:lysophospholipid acyltransferase (LPLAT)-like uncharacterized protein
MAWTVRVGTWLIRLLGRTWRIRTIHQEIFDTVIRDRRPVVFTLWHGQMLPLLYRHRDRGVVVLISEHKDGEIIARIAERLGFGTMRGSTSRGAGRALVGLVRSLSEGRAVAVTPDGPRGPARSFAPGALVAAQRAGAPIVPLGVSASRAWRLRSWDRFLIPKPFSKVTISYGEPTMVSGDSPRDAADEGPRFTALMDEVERLATDG